MRETVLPHLEKAQVGAGQPAVFLDALAQLLHLTLRDLEPLRPVDAIRWGWRSGLAGHGGYYSTTLVAGCSSQMLCAGQRGASETASARPVAQAALHTIGESGQGQSKLRLRSTKASQRPVCGLLHSLPADNLPAPHI